MKDFEYHKEIEEEKERRIFVVGKRLTSGETEAVGLETTAGKSNVENGAAKPPSSESNRGHENIPTVR